MEGLVVLSLRQKGTMICSNLKMNHLPLWFVLLSKFKHFEVSTSFLMVPMQRPFVASTRRKCQIQNGRQTDASIAAQHSCDVFMKLPFCLPDQKRTCQIPPPPLPPQLRSATRWASSRGHAAEPPGANQPFVLSWRKTLCRALLHFLQVRLFFFLAAPNIFFVTRANGFWGFT